MAIAISKTALSEIRSLVQANDHGGAYQMAARVLKFDELAERFGGINRQQLELGHLTGNLYEERHRLYKELLVRAQATLSAGEFQQLYGSF